MQKEMHVKFEKNCMTITLLIEGIKIKANVDLFNSRQTIFLCIRGKPDIPILQVNPPIKVSELEEKASELASFLKVSVKGS